MNRDLLKQSGENPQIEGVIESFELGFRMQTTVPDVMDLSKESPDAEMYGMTQAAVRRSAAEWAQRTTNFGRQCLMARRFAEAGVRFIEVAPHRLGPAHGAASQARAKRRTRSTSPSPGCSPI